MIETSEDIRVLVADEVSRVASQSRRRQLASLLREPQSATLGWDYGTAEERIAVWVVGGSADTSIALVYSATGFGPSFPWGFVSVAADSCGMDSQWHSGLEDAAIGAGLIDAPAGYIVPGPRE